MESNWRRRSRAVIERVVREVGTADPKALRKAMREAYPFGRREHWPYKIWLDEVRRIFNPPAPRKGAPAEEPGPLLELMR